MNNIISFQLPICPVAQMRSQPFVVKGHAMMHKASKQTRHEEQLMQLLALHKPEIPLQGSIELWMYAYLPIPQSKPQWFREASDQKIVTPDKKPDLDNILKHIKDCMERMGFYNNDSQIVKITAHKYYSISPHWEIRLKPLREPQSKKEYQEYLAGRF